MVFNLSKANFITCSFTIEDIADCLRGRLNREPMLGEVISVINSIDDDLMLEKMCGAGWDVIYSCLDFMYGKDGV